MDDSAFHQWSCAQKIEAQLLALLHAPKPTYGDIENLIHKMRVICERTIFLDFEYSVGMSIEKRLWCAHTLINNRYRKILGLYKDEKKQVVEKRKVEKHYVDFIKTSQFFYKAFVQRLASQFSGIKGLLRVAGKLGFGSLPSKSFKIVSPTVQELVEQSCHATLLHLGDLSRYRNMLRTKERSWEPAMGYYKLVNEIDPLSGIAHNKMAVIALADENHLNAVYHLYRAIAASNPDPLAPGNLEIEFKKILAARFSTSNNPLTILSWRFICLHAYFNEGIIFPIYEELQNEVLSRLISCLNEDSNTELLEKFVVISIAAQHYSSQRLRDQGSEKTSEAIMTLTYHTTFNNRMMLQLLSALLPELEDKSTNKESIGSVSRKSLSVNEKISHVARRLLPAIRYYTLWLASSKECMNPSIGPSETKINNRQLWRSYAIVLTKLVNYFPVKEMIAVPYLLEEDESTIGFLPFRGLELAKALDLYSQPNGQLKPYVGEHGVRRSHSNIEMQSRILDIVCCGIQLQMDDEIPLRLQNLSGNPVFHFIEESKSNLKSIPTQENVVCSASSPNKLTCDINVRQESAKLTPEEVNLGHEIGSDFQDSVELSMNRMVDSLLEPSTTELETDSYETFHNLFCCSKNKSLQPSVSSALKYRRHSTTPKLLPSLPGLYNSVFTPKPNELYLISPNSSTNSHQIPTLFLTPRTDQDRKESVQYSGSGYTYMSNISRTNSFKSYSGPGKRCAKEQVPTGCFLNANFNTNPGISLDTSSNSVQNLLANKNLTMCTGVSSLNRTNEVKRSVIRSTSGI